MVEMKSIWLDAEEAAAELGLPVDVVKEAVYNGELPALVIGGNIRINLDAAVEKTTVKQRSFEKENPNMLAMEGGAKSDSGLIIPMPVGLNWVNDLTCGEDFIHRWPQRRKDYGKDSSAKYTQAQYGEITLLSERFGIKVGRATRYGRGRLTVFFKKTPICEFMETADGKHWASLVKPNGKKVLRLGQTAPPLYQHVRLESYREVTDYEAWTKGSGIGIPKGTAIVIHIDDYRSAVHHAAARWLGKRGHIVEARGNSRSLTPH